MCYLRKETSDKCLYSKLSCYNVSNFTIIYLFHYGSGVLLTKEMLFAIYLMLHINLL